MMNLSLICSSSFFRNCIECLGFNSGPLKDKCLENCSNIIPTMVQQLGAGGKQCEQKDSESCWIKYSLEQLVGPDNYSAVIQSERGKTENIETSGMAPRPNGLVVNWRTQQHNFTVFFHTYFGYL